MAGEVERGAAISNEMTETTGTDEANGAIRSRSMSGVVLIAVVVTLGAVLIFLGDDVAAPLGRGDSAPDFTLPVLGESGTQRLDDLRGSVVLVNFWATWCKPCEEEMPAMERLYQELAPQGFELLAVSVDSELSDVETFQARMALSFPILLDPEQHSARQYQTTGFPESILIDPKGRIIERYVGPREWDHRDYVARIQRVGGLASETPAGAD